MGAIIERDYAGYPKLMGRLSQYTLAAQQENKWVLFNGRMAQQGFVRATKKWENWGQTTVFRGINNRA